MMRLTVHLNSYAKTEVKVLDANDTLMIIGNDEVSTVGKKSSIDWLFKALNYSTILKSELEIERENVFEKVKLVNLNVEQDNFKIPRVKIYPDCVFSPHTKTFLQFPNNLSKQNKKHPIKLCSLNKWSSDSLTYDKIATILFKNYEKFGKIYTTYSLVEDTQEAAQKRCMTELEYYQFKMFNNLNLKCYEI
jgi:hypothetical protein